MKIADNVKVSELTVGEFKALIREIVEEVVQQAVFELEQHLPDPDAGKEFKPEFADELRQALDEADTYYSLEQVKHELGLDE